MDPILVTGGTGTLGRHVVNRLKDEGREVRILTRGAGKDSDRVRFVTGDLLSGPAPPRVHLGRGRRAHAGPGADRPDDVQLLRHEAEGRAGRRRLRASLDDDPRDAVPRPDPLRGGEVDQAAGRARAIRRPVPAGRGRRGGHASGRSRAGTAGWSGTRHRGSACVPHDRSWSVAIWRRRADAGPCCRSVCREEPLARSGPVRTWLSTGPSAPGRGRHSWPITWLDPLRAPQGSATRSR